MKVKYVKLKNQKDSDRCGICVANFQVWLNSLGVAERRREKIEQRIFSYCPVCQKTEGN